MSKQFKAMTRGGYQYLVTVRDHGSGCPIRGSVQDSGLTVYVHWDDNGRCNPDGESPYDLIPIEAEAPSPAKVRVNLALAACSLRAVVVEYQRVKDAEHKAGQALLDAFVASGETEVVVKIDGDHYRFWTNSTKVFFRKIEVL